MKKAIYLAILTINLSSCCPRVTFAHQDKIVYINSNSGDTLDYEFAVINLSRKKDYCDLFQAMRTNAPTVLNKKDIAVYQGGKPLKFDLFVSHPRNWDKIKKDTITLPEQSLVKIHTKAKTALGQTLTVVERNYPFAGDSIVIKINFDDIIKHFGSSGFYRKESVVGKMLPRVN